MHRRSHLIRRQESLEWPVNVVIEEETVGNTLDFQAALHVGDEVKFADPKTNDERHERFVVAELRGERILVAMKDSGMSIVPTFAYLAKDLVAI